MSSVNGTSRISGDNKSRRSLGIKKSIDAADECMLWRK